MIKTKKDFSIVIAVAPDRNAEVLKSIKKVDYPKNQFEIIIEKGINPSENRNRGAARAGGETIVFIDDDAVIDENLLKNAKKFMKKYPKTDIFGGPQLTPKDETGFAKISGYALSSLFGAGNTMTRYSKQKIILNADETALTSANLFCKARVFKKIKFNPQLWPGEDPDFIANAKKYGFNVAYYPEIIVYHRRRKSAGLLIKQIYNYGKVRPKKEALLETIKMPAFLVPSLFLVYLICLPFLAIYSSLLWIIPLALYLLLDIYFSFVNSLINLDLGSFLALIVIFPIIHLSYGAGFLKGLINKYL